MESTRTIGAMELTADLAKIEEQWGVLFPMLEDFTARDVLGKTKEGVSEWNVGQQLAHMAKVLGGVGMFVEQSLADPEKDAGLEPNDLGKMLLGAGEIPRGRGVAPDFTRAEPAVTAKEIRESLDTARAKWNALAERTDELASVTSTFPHHHLGPMRPSQWTHFIAIHTAHHLKIIDDILADG